MTIDQPVTASGQFCVVRLPEEVDLAVASNVLESLLSTITRGGPHLVVDASDVTFMDSSGLNALVRARDRAEAMGGSLHVVAPEGQVRRVLEVSRLDRTLHRVDDLDTALACLTTGRDTHVCQLPTQPTPPRSTEASEPPG